MHRSMQCHAAIAAAGLAIVRVRILAAPFRFAPYIWARAARVVQAVSRYARRGSRPARCSRPARGSRRQPGPAAISVCGPSPVAAGSPRRVWCCNYRCVTPAAGFGSVLARVFDLRFQLQGSRSPVAPGRADAVDPRGLAAVDPWCQPRVVVVEPAGPGLFWPGIMVMHIYEVDPFLMTHRHAR